MLPKRALTPHPAAPHVAAWRARRLREAGLRAALAERVAANTDYDVHAILELVDRGCPADLAVRIVAPLDGGPPW